MPFTFNRLALDDDKNLSVIFQNSAGNEIIMDMDYFSRFVPAKGDQPYIPSQEVGKAAARIIIRGYDYFPRHA